MDEVYLAYDMNKEKMECASHTLVIKNDALNAKYAGGLRSFVEKYNASCNRDITVTCDMGSEIGEKVHDIDDNGLVPDEDYWMIDCWSYLMAVANPHKMAKPHEIETGIDWLKCELAEEESVNLKIYVWYVDAVEQSDGRPENDAYCEAFNLLNLGDYRKEECFPLLTHSLKQMLNDPQKGLQWVKNHKQTLMGQIEYIRALS